MKKIVLLLTVLLTVTGFAQSNLWQKLDAKDVVGLEKLPRDSHPTKFELYSLNFNELKNVLASAPKRLSGEVSNVIVAFPNAEGELQNFRIYEASVMHPDLAARHQEIQAYVGKGIDDRTATIRFSTTLFGLHTMTFAADKSASYIDPYSKDLNHYMVYSKSDLTTNRVFECGVVNESDISPSDIDETEVLNRAENGLFKTYRLAMACTIEYAAFHVNAAGLNAGTLAQKKAAVLAAMNVTMVRLNAIYENDMALTMVLVPNNENAIFITSDSFSNTNAGALINESQTVIDDTIGSANYDIGHTVSTGGGGLAQKNVPCTGSKARGITGLDAPVGDPYDIDYVAHEMGHQWGCDHTFNNSCGGNVATTSSYEPGSGSTIMAYANICPPNVQGASDAYFHARSILQMINHVNGTGNCGVILPNNNSAPVIATLQNFTIPKSTAFVLDAQVTDADGDALTYCWEQYNQQISTQPPLATSASGPNYRSLNPSSSSKRYFPVLSSVLAGNLTPTWEVTPSVARTMTFSLVVRDNELINGGQTKRATNTVTVDVTAGPFTVTSQSTQEAWAQGASKTITWNVAGTNVAPVNTANVTIKLSTDGGLTFPHVLVAGTPNDGSETITVPSIPASQTCRLMVMGDGNIYYAVNATNFLLGYSITNECVTYNYTGAAFTVPDGVNSNTVKTINVPTAGTVSDVNVTINATHPNIQNLVIAMTKAGGGGVFTLFNQQCMNSANMNVTFDAQGSALTCASPTAGTYIPPTGANLNALNVSVPAGNWSFAFKDLVAGNVGTINSIQLEVCKNILAPLGNEEFSFQDLAIYPNPNSGEFTIQFTSSSSNKVAIEVVDLRGRKIVENQYATSGLFNQTIQLNNAQSGIYLVSITDGDKKIVKKIVVE
jgi:subtilisin-like proprotein convertase family protein